MSQETFPKWKSFVRIGITIVAAAYLFIGSAYLIYVFFVFEGDKLTEGMKQALTIFNTILPIATGIITYWFAARSNKSS